VAFRRATVCIHRLRKARPMSNIISGSLFFCSNNDVAVVLGCRRYVIDPSAICRDRRKLVARLLFLFLLLILDVRRNSASWAPKAVVWSRDESVVVTTAWRGRWNQAYGSRGGRTGACR
jgi:hypothetical protein